VRVPPVKASDALRRFFARLLAAEGAEAHEAVDAIQREVNARVMGSMRTDITRRLPGPAL